MRKEAGGAEGAPLLKKVEPRRARPFGEDGRAFAWRGGARLLSRLLSLNPVGIVLLVLGAVLMLLGKAIPERWKIPAKLVSLALAVAGATLCFL